MTFQDCHHLAEVIIPNSVTSIGNMAFQDCHNLTKISIPNSVISIGKEVFEHCRGLSSIIIPNSVTRIGDDTFGNCSSLTEIIIPDSIISIGDRAFMRCKLLREVSLPNSVTSIGVGSFAHCNGLNLIVSKDNPAYSVVDRALFDKRKNMLHTYFDIIDLSSYIIPSSVTSIGDGAFCGCSKLKEIIIPNSITSIGRKTFFGCSGLTEITIPNSVISIVNNTFYYCNGLTTITYQDKILKVKCVDGFCMVVKKVHAIGEFTVFSCVFFNTNDKCFVAEKDGLSAHGKTIKNAIADVVFKQLSIFAKDEHIKRIRSKETLNAIDYRLLTGACLLGVTNFMNDNNLHEDMNKEYPVKKVLEMTSGYFGSEVLKKVLEFKEVV